MRACSCSFLHRYLFYQSLCVCVKTLHVPCIIRILWKSLSWEKRTHLCKRAVYVYKMPLHLHQKAWEICAIVMRYIPRVSEGMLCLCSQPFATKSLLRLLQPRVFVLCQCLCQNALRALSLSVRLLWCDSMGSMMLSNATWFLLKELSLLVIVKQKTWGLVQRFATWEDPWKYMGSIQTDCMQCVCVCVCVWECPCVCTCVRVCVCM